MSDEKKDKCSVCGKEGECIEVPTYEVQVLEVAEKGDKKIIIEKTINIEQLNSVGWPSFVHVDTPDELRDMIMAAVLTYQFGKKSIDKEFERVSKVREGMVSSKVIDKESTRH